MEGTGYFQTILKIHPIAWASTSILTICAVWSLLMCWVVASRNQIGFESWYLFVLAMLSVGLAVGVSAAAIATLLRLLRSAPERLLPDSGSIAFVLAFSAFAVFWNTDYEVLSRLIHFFPYEHYEAEGMFFSTSRVVLPGLVIYSGAATAGLIGYGTLEKKRSRLISLLLLGVPATIVVGHRVVQAIGTVIDWVF